jgi:acyl carrier protein phosphodiesterase
MGDFVKGPIPDTFSAGVRRGIDMHRKVDAFANESIAFRRSKGRLDDAYRSGKAVLVDVFYDHLLARDWARYANVPLEDFARTVYGILEENSDILPDALRRVVPQMVRYNWLVSYRDVHTVGRVLERIAARLKRPNPIARGLEELLRHYAELAEDCDAFLSEAGLFLEDLGFTSGAR